MREHAVVIAGGGPTGMMLAAELALAKVDVVVVERRPDHGLVGSRAGGLHARTIEVLDQRGVADRFLAAGQTVQAMSFGSTVLDISDFPSRHPYTLALWQSEIERIMAGWVAELPVTTHYEREVAGFAQDDASVDVQLSDGETLRAQYLVGCDGGRSVVRKLAGIDFPGWEATRSNLIAEVEMADEPELGMRNDAAGVQAIGPIERGYRVVLTEAEIGSGEATLDELRTALVKVYGTDFGVHSPVWVSRFTDATRQAAAYRSGRVLLAGDAAHIHYPAGGQGLSLGVQDAVNLGWKLAQVVKGTSPVRLLDTYFAERHRVTARALRYTMAQTMLQRHDDRVQALLEVLADVTAMDEPRRHLAGLVSGLDIHYDLGDGHPLLGRRMPDLDLDGGGRVFELLHDARPVLLDFGASGLQSEAVPVVEASYTGAWELPVLGAVSAPSAVLVRPDGYVAWVGAGTDAGLSEALATWLGH